MLQFGSPRTARKLFKSEYSGPDEEWTHHRQIFEIVKDSGRVPGDRYPAVKGAEGDFSYLLMTQRDTNRAVPPTIRGLKLRRKSENVVVETVF